MVSLLMCYPFFSDWMSQQEKSTKMAKDILRLTMVSITDTFSIINIFYLSARSLILDSHQYIKTYFSQEPLVQLNSNFIRHI